MAENKLQLAGERTRLQWALDACCSHIVYLEYHKSELLAAMRDLVKQCRIYVNSDDAELPDITRAELALMTITGGSSQ